MKRKLSIYGAAIGDYYGSYWEFRLDKPQNLMDALKLRQFGHKFTDDTVMTAAIAKAVLDKGRANEKGKDVDFKRLCIDNMKKLGHKYPTSYGGAFARWLFSNDDKPYYSFGNGAAMRISPVPLAMDNYYDMSRACLEATEATHDHPFSLHYALLVSTIIHHCKTHGKDVDPKKETLKALIKQFSPNDYEQVKSMSIERLNAEYTFTEKVQETVPQAIYCFLSSTSFRDCLGRSLYIGGDSDTLAAIACSMAAVYYGDDEVEPYYLMLPKFPEDIGDILKVFSKEYLC